MKKKIKKREVKFSDIIEEEIKNNSIRHGFSKNIITHTKNLKKKKATNIKISQKYPLLQLMVKIAKTLMMQFGLKVIRIKQK